MKKVFVLLTGVLFIMACKEKPATDTTVSAPAPTYPYTIKDPNNWVTDTSHTNTLTALNALKAFETMDTTSLKKCFADSLTFNYDGGVFKGTVSQFTAMANEMAKTMKNLKLKVTDWETVTGKTKKEEWVTVWYMQYWTDAKGKADSIQLVNDMQFKAGKIVQLDEYTRRFTPTAK
jgi:hypothetical protein